MTWWIGRAWKAREGCSEAVLRPEGAAVGRPQRRQTLTVHVHTRALHTSTLYVWSAGAGEAVTGAGWPHPFPSRTRSCNAPAPTILPTLIWWDNRSLPPPRTRTPFPSRPLRGGTRRGVEQWQLVGLITRRSAVRIRPPLLPSPVALLRP